MVPLGIPRLAERNLVRAVWSRMRRCEDPSGSRPAGLAFLIRQRLGAQRITLFCLASGTDWERAGVTHATAQQLLVRGLIDLILCDYSTTLRQRRTLCQSRQCSVSWGRTSLGGRPYAGTAKFPR